MSVLAPAAFGPRLARPWLQFQLLPSLLMHPERQAAELPAALRGRIGEGADRLPAATLHRHWSARLLREPGYGPVVAADDPALPVAMLEPAVLERLALWCGAALLAGPLRRVIAREDVARLQHVLGDDGLAYVRRAADLPAAAESLEPARAGEQFRALGWAVLAVALETASAPVASRARLRLPPGSPARGRLPESLQHGPAALAGARAVLQKLEPEWLSSFPAAR